MLILNGKIFNPSSKADDDMVVARQHYLECVKDIRDKFGKYGYVKIIRRKPQKRNEGGHLEPTPMIIFPCKVHTNVQFSVKTPTDVKDAFGGLETWEYSSGTPLKKDNDYHSTPRSIKFTTQERVLYLDKDMDLIYFLLLKSPHVFYNEAVTKYNKRSSGSLTVDDRESRERIIAEGRKDAAKLNVAVYGDQTSPLFEESVLRATAAAWGVEEALLPTTSEDELRNLLYANVMAQQATKERTIQGRGVEDFLEFISYDNAIKARALVLDSISRQRIRYDIAKSTYIFSSSDVPLLVIPEKAKNSKFDYLCTFLLADTNKTMWERFRREVIDTKYLDEHPFPWIKWLCKEEGLPIAAKSEKDLRAALSDRYK